MNAKKESIKSTFFSGLILLFPIGVLIITIVKIFGYVHNIIEPIERLIPLSTTIGAIIIDFLVILCLLFLCYVIGLIAKSILGARAISAFENQAATVIPGYAVTKQKLITSREIEGKENKLKVVLVEFDDYSQIAFEIERIEANRACVYLPGAPDLWSGQVIIVAQERVTTLAEDIKITTKILRNLGRGTNSIMGVTTETGKIGH